MTVHEGDREDFSASF